MKKHCLAILAFAIITLPLGWFWHLEIFSAYYGELQVYRDDILIEFGVLSMLIQGAVYSYIYSRLFAGEPIIGGALKFMALAIPLALSYSVFVIGAKHHMSSPMNFTIIETAFVFIHYIISAPLIAWVHRK